MTYRPCADCDKKFAPLIRTDTVCSDCVAGYVARAARAAADLPVPAAPIPWGAILHYAIVIGGGVWLVAWVLRA